MTPERRARAVEFLRSFADDVLREAADVLEAMREAPRLPPLPQLPVLSEGWDGQPELLAQMLADGRIKP